jgi:hypothetical protein
LIIPVSNNFPESGLLEDMPFVTLCGDMSLLPINTSSPGFIIRVCGLKTRFPLSFLVMIITPATDELYGLDVVFGAVVVTEHTQGKISFWFEIIRISNIPAIQCKKKNRFQL